MKQSGHLNPSEETGTGCSVTSKYGRTPTNKHGGVGRQQQQSKQALPFEKIYVSTWQENQISRHYVTDRTLIWKQNSIHTHNTNIYSHLHCEGQWGAMYQRKEL